MSRMGDILARLAEGVELTRSEINTLRFEGNNMQGVASTVAGLVNSDGSLDLSFLPIRVLYSKRLTASTASIKVQIPSAINHLMLFGSTRSDEDVATWDYNKLHLNDDAGATYESQELYGSDAAVVASQNRAQSHLAHGGSTTAVTAAYFAGQWFAMMPNIQSSLYKGIISIVGGRFTAADNVAAVAGAWWENTARIKSLTFTPGGGSNYLAGSSFSVIGIV